MVQVVIGVGSNIEREKNICSALDQLQETFGELLISPVYQGMAEVSTELSTTLSAQPPGKQKNTQPSSVDGIYYNLVLAINTEIDVAEVKHILKAIEEKQGRERNAEAVTIDLDLLLYGDYLGELDGNAIPHHDITERAYVLRPLSDLLPAREHPVYAKSFSALWEEFTEDKRLQSVDFVWSNQLISSAACLPVI
ncbi:MAG: 2-amino-4-hydroxy-6-hydroxymethyldihydropteridine diphosphokinase [Cellvibrionaceae bacterium]